jgi:hypothetical protein
MKSKDPIQRDGRVESAFHNTLRVAVVSEFALVYELVSNHPTKNKKTSERLTIKTTASKRITIQFSDVNSCFSLFISEVDII